MLGLAYQEDDFSDQRVREGLVQALAAVRYGYIKDETGFLYSLGRGFSGDSVMLRGAGSQVMGQYAAVDVGTVISRPDSIDARPNCVGELLYAIIDWAASIGKMVTTTPANAEEQDLFESLGFEFFGGEEDWQMVYVLRIPTPKIVSGAGLLLDLAD